MAHPLRRAVDAALEASVVGSFTKIGHELRRRLYDWLDLNSLEGRARRGVGQTPAR